MSPQKFLGIAMLVAAATLVAGCGGGGGGGGAKFTSTTTTGGTLAAAPGVPAAAVASPSNPTAVVAQAQDLSASQAGIQANLQIRGLTASINVVLTSAEGQQIATGRTDASGNVTFSRVTLASGASLLVKSAGGETLLTASIRVNQLPLTGVTDTALTIVAGQSVTLTASPSDPDGDAFFAEWTQVSGPPIEMPAANTTRFSFQPAHIGTYVFRFAVTDAAGDRAQSDVTLTVNPVVVNNNPVVSAGADRTANQNSLVVLEASANDPDGDSLTYAWTRTSGPEVTLTNPNTFAATFTATQAGTYVFSVRALDGRGGEASDSVTVVVNPVVQNLPPVVSAGADRTVTAGAQITLTGTASDPENGALTYAWTQVSGPVVTLANADQKAATFTPSVAGPHVFRFTARDAANASSSDEVTITVEVATENRRPVASVGAPQWGVGYGATVTLSASGSTDPDGAALTYQWTQASSDRVKIRITGANTASATFVTTDLVSAFTAAKMPIPLTTGVLAIPSAAATSYNFTVTVRDPQGLTATNSVEVLSVARSGTGTNTGIGQQVYLNGGGAPTFNWTVAQRPTGSTAQLIDPTSRFPIFVPDRAGIYRFSSGSGTVTINASNYLGNNAETCSACHETQVTSWSATPHASALKSRLDRAGGTYSASSLRRHTVGYDLTPSANNKGFDDEQQRVGWSIPTRLGPGTFDAQPAEIKALANVQCESCHGPATNHNGNRARIAVNFDVENCAQCHSSQPAEWHTAGKHRNPTSSPTGAGRNSCVGCHSTYGFIQVASRLESTTGTIVLTGSYSGLTDTRPKAFTCASCHDPHKNQGEGASHLRVFARDQKLIDGTVVSDTGASATCIQCHHARRPVSSLATYRSGRTGPHYSPQTDMLVGTNGFEFGGHNYQGKLRVHDAAVPGKCVECHMAEPVNKRTGQVAEAGGHTWRMRLPDGSPNTAVTCAKCHDDAATTFDRPARGDFDGNGRTDGIQTEVRGLMELVDSRMRQRNEAGWTKWLASEDATGLTTEEKRVGWNYVFVHDDGSHGVHNPAYTVELLQQSYKVINGGGLPPGMAER